MEKQERKDGVDGGTTTHTHVHIHMCSAIKIRYYKKRSAALRAEAFTYFSARQVVAARNGKTVAETLLWKGVGLFSSQKKGKWLYRDEI